jgi:drug/metabolite transporter (DMT)-like permease
MKSPLYADGLALAAIALWGTLASLGVSLAHVPPFLLTGLSLLIGSLIALPLSRFKLAAWRVPPRTLALGVYGLFMFHFLLFLALRHAPPVEANLINYLWPLGMVVMAPLFLPGLHLHWQHVGAAVVGFAGAAIAIVGRSGGGAGLQLGFEPGYLLALGAAFVWASYSLLTRRVPAFPTAAVGSFAAVSGVLSLVCHWALEPATPLAMQDWLLILAMGLGPLGGAFFLWDAAIKAGDPRRIGLMAFLTPLLSTALLVTVRGDALQWNVLLAAVLIIGAAWWGSRVPQ